MDSIRVSEAPDPGSIPGEATTHSHNALIISSLCFLLIPSLRNSLRFTFIYVIKEVLFKLA